VSTRTLDHPPGLTSLFARAALTAPLHRGDTLPDSQYVLPDQRIDTDQLASYNRVCGFPLADRVSPTFPHILAFPLSVALMSERAFPFPLVGTVHVNNTITVHRPVCVDDVLDLRVWADDLRPHPSGKQFDLVAEATSGGELVWSSRSTYLRRGGVADSAAKPPRGVADLPPGATAILRVPGDIGRRYGAVSGDRNPIHLHPLTAKAFGFSSAIAHGMWLEARTLATLEGRLPDAYTVDVAFKTPVLLPASVAVTSTPTEDGWQLDVRNPRSGKPHLAGTVRSSLAG
jgi:acyl dehydratase